MIYHLSKQFIQLALSVLCALFFVIPAVVDAATLRVSPDTGVYGTGQTISAKVVINTDGKPVNAAEGQITFNPKELQVLSVSRGSSIFSLWTEEPNYSNAAGTVTFGGGSPQGYTGSQGTVVTITFKALAAGTPKVVFAQGSVLAADGLGTNVLTSMKGASYTISADATVPEAEYIAPQNTPTIPLVTSRTHPDQKQWYRETAASLSWTVPSDIVAVRTLLDTNPSSVPTIVYEERLTEKQLSDLPQGISYFHVQFKNGNGWGKVAHYRLAIDSEPPMDFTLKLINGTEEPSVSKKTFSFSVTDTSPIVKYKIQIDGGEPFDFVDSDGVKQYTLEAQGPGHHSISVEAFDSVGFGRVATFSFDVEAFEAPVFTEYPERLPTTVIPALKGTTRPTATVEVTLRDRNGTAVVGEVLSSETGDFTFVPTAKLPVGVYELQAIATLDTGAQSLPSQPITIIVEESSLTKAGTLVLNTLSVLVPTIALLFLLGFGMWYLWHRLRAWKRYILKETKEAEYRLAVEFDAITAHLQERVEQLKKTKRGKLSAEETTLIDDLTHDIDRARDRILKEISDIDNIVQ